MRRGCFAMPGRNTRVEKVIPTIKRKNVRCKYTMLIPGGSNEGEPRLRDWKLVVNAKLDPDI